MNYYDTILKMYFGFEKYFRTIIRIVISLFILAYVLLYNFINLNMPNNVFGNSSNYSDNRIDTSLFVQKHYLRSNYLESKNEEDIELKQQ